MSAAEDIQHQAVLAENRGPLTLYRADTHGTESVVVANVCENFAKSTMQLLEEKPHHQGYWYKSPEREPACP